MKKNGIKIGVIGCGTIGTGVVKCLLENKKYLQRHLGAPLELARVADLFPRKKRPVKIPTGIMTKDSDLVLNDPEIDIIVELVGGTTFAKDVVLSAMKKGKSVVTANKALIAKYGLQLHNTAEKHGVDLYYEASVGGGIPIIKTLREAFVGNKINSVWGILNGTCNYMLSNMTDAGLTFETALEQAKINGYAEADPTLDIGGFDTQHKIGILASLAFGRWVPQNKIYVEGIENVTDFDIKCADEMGYVIKLLGIARVENKGVSVRVYPAFIPNTTMLGNVKSAFNAIEIDGAPIGTAILTGLGAGMGATSSAVVADIVDIARNIASGSVGRLTALTFMNKQLPFRKIDDISTRYYLRFKVDDKPGVVAKIAKILGDKNISLRSVIQHEPHSETKSVHVTFMTHLAREKDIRAAVKSIDNLKCVKSKTTIFRVEAD